MPKQLKGWYSGIAPCWFDEETAEVKPRGVLGWVFLPIIIALTDAYIWVRCMVDEDWIPVFQVEVEDEE